MGPVTMTFSLTLALLLGNKKDNTTILIPPLRVDMSEIELSSEKSYELSIAKLQGL